ncbi:MAG TPA: sigma-54 dependent transcriptional regulator [Planctomycetota bacterium]|nr:sigma-54 dependent transcriptional regulator [Planctomycetota bacterium]
MTADQDRPLALLVDDDPAFLGSLELLVAREGFECRTAEGLADARRELERAVPDVLLIDLNLPEGDGLEFARTHGLLETTEVIVVTGEASVESAVQALLQGASDYLRKPLDAARLTSCLRGVSRTRALKRQVRTLNGQLRGLGRFGAMVGRSPEMRRVFDLVQRVAPTDASVLIYGESGVGKELVAQAIHDLSPRSRMKFLPVNCGAIPANLIESELFGHERGSFTGADRRRDGIFERARGGTLLLDEITEMPLELQVKLLRVLENRTYTRVGGQEVLDADVRVIAASNREPRKAVTDGALREDLYYRLNVVPLVVPPLRERGEDVLLLAQHFLEQLNAEHQAHKSWSQEALRWLEQQPWRGNVRELKNATSRAWILGESRLGVEHLASAAAPSHAGSSPARLEMKVGSTISDVERMLIEATLDHFHGDKSRTAEALGISVKTLYNRLSVYSASRAAGSG